MIAALRRNVVGASPSGNGAGISGFPLQRASRPAFRMCACASNHNGVTFIGAEPTQQPPSRLTEFITPVARRHRSRRARGRSAGDVAERDLPARAAEDGGAYL